MGERATLLEDEPRANKDMLTCAHVRAQRAVNAVLLARPLQAYCCVAHAAVQKLQMTSLTPEVNEVALVDLGGK